MVKRELFEAGFNVERYFAELRYLESEEAVVSSILSGRTDAGIVKSGFVESLSTIGALDLSVIRAIEFPVKSREKYPILLSTRLYPEWPMAALTHVDDEIAEAVAATLLLMDASDPGADAAGIVGFSIPANY